MIVLIGYINVFAWLATDKESLRMEELDSLLILTILEHLHDLMQSRMINIHLQ